MCRGSGTLGLVPEEWQKRGGAVQLGLHPTTFSAGEMPFDSKR